MPMLAAAPSYLVAFGFAAQIYTSIETNVTDMACYGGWVHHEDRVVVEDGNLS